MTIYGRFGESSIIADANKAIAKSKKTRTEFKKLRNERNTNARKVIRDIREIVTSWISVGGSKECAFDAIVKKLDEMNIAKIEELEILLPTPFFED